MLPFLVERNFHWSFTRSFTREVIGSRKTEDVCLSVLTSHPHLMSWHLIPLILVSQCQTYQFITSLILTNTRVVHTTWVVFFFFPCWNHKPQMAPLFLTVHLQLTAPSCTARKHPKEKFKPHVKHRGSKIKEIREKVSFSLSNHIFSIWRLRSLKTWQLPFSIIDCICFSSSC